MYDVIYLILYGFFKSVPKTVYDFVVRFSGHTVNTLTEIWLHLKEDYVC